MDRAAGRVDAAARQPQQRETGLRVAAVVGGDLVGGVGLVPVALQAVHVTRLVGREPGCVGRADLLVAPRGELELVEGRGPLATDPHQLPPVHRALTR